jgi:hypothetical protein
MHTRFIPRLFVLSLLFAFVFGGAIHDRAAAADHTRWTNTVDVEDALVQACAGFKVTGSYTLDTAYLDVVDYYGYAVSQRRDVTFTGALGNAATGKSYAYDGHFTRIRSLYQSKVTITNLSLRFEVDTPGEFTVSLKRVDFDLGDDPHAVVKAIVPNVLQMDLCQLFSGSSALPAPEPQLVPSFDDRMGKDQSVIDDTESSALNPPPNYQSGDSTVTCDPRKGYPQDCAVLP